MIRALDAPIAAIAVRCDPLPLDIRAELTAVRSGRATYDLIPAGDHQEIEYRDETRMRKREYPVIAAHECPGPVPATAGNAAHRRKRKRSGNARPPF